MKKTIILFILLLVSAVCFASTIHVPADYPKIQFAIDAAVTGDTVFVAPGTYIENLVFQGKTISVICNGDMGTAVIDGGYPLDPDYGSTVNFLGQVGADALLEGFTVFNGKGTFDVLQGTYGYYGGGIYIDHCSPTIRNCHIVGNTAGTNGGGVCILNYSKPVFDHCEITNNIAGLDGGGMMIHNSPTTINGCIITNNMASQNGGGISSSKFKLTMIDCSIEENKCYNNGGGIDALNTSGTISGCSISRNRILPYAGESTKGGGIYCDGPTVLTVKDCLLEENLANYGGGIFNMSNGLRLEDSELTGNSASYGGGICDYDFIRLRGCSFIENMAEEEGGAINFRNYVSTQITACAFHRNVSKKFGGGIHYEDGYSYNPSPTYLYNCIFTENEGEYGGGVSSFQSSPTLYHCTFTKNSSLRGGGALYCKWNSETHLYNSILWENIPTEIYSNHNSPITVTGCCVQGGFPGAENIDADPLFVDWDRNDLHLSYASPCRDTAHTPETGWPSENTDFDGNPRHSGDAWDMGADEFHKHFYCIGDFTPGGYAIGRFIDLPSTSPVALCIGSGVLDPPLPTMWGDFCLESPLYVLPLGAVPSTGVLEIADYLPPLQPAPYDRFLQALIGTSPDSLTDLFILEVR